MTTLTKISNLVYVPGSSSVPGLPGTLPTPGYSVTSTTYQLSYIITTAANGQYNSITGEYAPTIIATPQYTPVTTTTTVAATSGSAPTPPSPPTPAQWVATQNLGWTSSATGLSQLTADGSLNFSTSANTQGVVVGLATKNTGVDYSQINFGLYAAQGVVTVIENGITINTASVTAVSADILSISVRGGVVSYFKNGVAFYTSLVPATLPMYAMASLYASGDAVLGAAWGAVLGPSTAAGSFQPLQGYANASSAQLSDSNAAMLPITGNSFVDTPAYSVGSMAPMSSYAVDHVSDSMAQVVMQPLCGVSYAQVLTPAYSITNGATAYVIGFSLGTTGGVATVASTTQLISGVSSNFNYASSAIALQPMIGEADNIPLPQSILVGTWQNNYSLSASMSFGTPNSFAGQIGFSFTGFAGATGISALPMPTLSASSTLITMGEVYATINNGDVFTYSYAGGIGSGTSGFVGEVVNAALPSPTVSGYAGSVQSGATLSGYNFTGSGTTGVGASAEFMTFGSPILLASGTTGFLAEFTSAMPMITPVASTRSSTGLTFSRPTLVAVATPFSTIVYEAYAVTLNRALDNPNKTQEPIYPVSHYVNYPFNQVLRFGANYYGVGTDGLHLIGGDTDNGTPIPWSVETTLCDLGTPQLKRVVAMTVGGRILSELTMSLYVNEAGADSYDYTTPLGTNAQNYRQLFGKGVRTRYFALGLSDTVGNYFELDSLNIEHYPLTRRA